MRHATFGLACMLLTVPLAASGADLATAPAGAAETTLSMQADEGHPLWDLLRSTGQTPDEWAVLLTSDANGNGKTDFLDLLLAVALPTDLASTPVELLAYGDQTTLDDIGHEVDESVLIEPPGALFLTLPLNRLDALDRPGVSLVVWEPRIHASSPTNPAGGNPAGMPQNSIHFAGFAWTGTPAYKGAGVTIGILDTGVDTTHQALDGGKVTEWVDCAASGTSAYDDHGHGTHVASIAAGDDGSDFRGMAYEADIAGVKILSGTGSGNIGWFQCGVCFLVSGCVSGGSPQADVASMSAGLAVPPLGITTLNGGELDVFAWQAAANSLPANGIPFAVAAGNWIGTAVDVIGVDETTHVGINGVNQVSDPAYSRWSIAVGAIDFRSAAATFTALGPGPLGSVKPDVAALGVNTWGALEGTTDRYAQWDGTSMATPIVGGALALMHQKNASLVSLAYGDHVRNGAGPACLVSLGTCTLVEQPDPNFVVGHGVLKVTNSLTLVP